MYSEGFHVTPSSVTGSKGGSLGAAKPGRYFSKATVEDILDEDREERILQKYEDQKDDWNSIRQYLADRTNRLPEHTSMCAAEEYRERVETIDLLERAIPPKERGQKLSWYVSLRNGEDEVMHVGSVFSGLTLRRKRSEPHIEESIRTPWLREVYLSRDAEIPPGKVGRGRTWRHSKYLQERLKRYERQMQQHAVSHLNFDESLELQGIGLSADGTTLQNDQNFVDSMLQKSSSGQSHTVEEKIKIMLKGNQDLGLLKPYMPGGSVRGTFESNDSSFDSNKLMDVPALSLSANTISFSCNTGGTVQKTIKLMNRGQTCLFYKLDRLSHRRDGGLICNSKEEQEANQARFQHQFNNEDNNKSNLTGPNQHQTGLKQQQRTNFKNALKVKPDVFSKGAPDSSLYLSDPVSGSRNPEAFFDHSFFCWKSSGSILPGQFEEIPFTFCPGRAGVHCEQFCLFTSPSAQVVPFVSIGTKAEANQYHHVAANDPLMDTDKNATIISSVGANLTRNPSAINVDGQSNSEQIDNEFGVLIRLSGAATQFDDLKEWRNLREINLTKKQEENLRIEAVDEAERQKRPTPPSPPNVKDDESERRRIFNIRNQNEGAVYTPEVFAKCTKLVGKLNDILHDSYSRIRAARNDYDLNARPNIVSFKTPFVPKLKTGFNEPEIGQELDSERQQPVNWDLSLRSLRNHIIVSTCFDTTLQKNLLQELERIRFESMSKKDLEQSSIYKEMESVLLKVISNIQPCLNQKRLECNLHPLEHPGIPPNGFDESVINISNEDQTDVDANNDDVPLECVEYKHRLDQFRNQLQAQPVYEKGQKPSKDDDPNAWKHNAIAEIEQNLLDLIGNSVKNALLNENNESIDTIINDGLQKHPLRLTGEIARAIQMTESSETVDVATRRVAYLVDLPLLDSNEKSKALLFNAAIKESKIANLGRSDIDSAFLSERKFTPASLEDCFIADSELELLKSKLSPLVDLLDAGAHSIYLLANVGPASQFPLVIPSEIEAEATQLVQEAEENAANPGIIPNTKDNKKMSPAELEAQASEQAAQKQQKIADMSRKLYKERVLDNLTSKDLSKFKPVNYLSLAPVLSVLEEVVGRSAPGGVEFISQSDLFSEPDDENYEALVKKIKDSREGSVFLFENLACLHAFHGVLVAAGNSDIEATLIPEMTRSNWLRNLFVKTFMTDVIVLDDLSSLTCTATPVIDVITNDDYFSTPSKSGSEIFLNKPVQPPPLLVAPWDFPQACQRVIGTKLKSALSTIGKTFTRFHGEAFYEKAMPALPTADELACGSKKKNLNVSKVTLGGLDDRIKEREQKKLKKIKYEELLKERTESLVIFSEFDNTLDVSRPQDVRRMLKILSSVGHFATDVFVNGSLIKLLLTLSGDNSVVSIPSSNSSMQNADNEQTSTINDNNNMLATIRVDDFPSLPLPSVSNITLSPEEILEAKNHIAILYGLAPVTNSGRPITPDKAVKSAAGKGTKSDANGTSINQLKGSKAEQAAQLEAAENQEIERRLKEKKDDLMMDAACSTRDLWRNALCKILKSYKENNVKLHVPNQIVLKGKCRLSEDNEAEIKRKIEAMVEAENQAEIAAYQAAAGGKGTKNVGGNKQSQVDAEELSLKIKLRVENAINEARLNAPEKYISINLPEGFVQKTISFFLCENDNDKMNLSQLINDCKSANNLNDVNSSSGFISSSGDEHQQGDNNGDVWLFPRADYNEMFQTGSIKIAGCSRADAEFLNNFVVNKSYAITWIGNILVNEKLISNEDDQTSEWQDVVKASRAILRSIEQRGNAEGAYDDELPEDDEWRSDNEDEEQELDSGDNEDDEDIVGESKRSNQKQDQTAISANEPVSVSCSFLSGNVCNWALHLCRDGSSAFNILDTDGVLLNVLTTPKMPLAPLHALDLSANQILQKQQQLQHILQQKA